MADVFEAMDREMAGNLSSKQWLDSRIMLEDELPDWLSGEVEQEVDPENAQILIDAGMRSGISMLFLIC